MPQDAVEAEVAELLRLEDRTLHDAWKATDPGGIFSFQSPAEIEARKVYVPLANGWLERATSVLKHRTAYPQIDWAAFEKTYLKILERRDQLMKQGYGTPTPGMEAKIKEKVDEMLKSDTAQEVKEWGKLALVGLGLLLLIVVLK